VCKLGGASVLSQFIGIAAAPIFSRLFNPDQVGIMTLFLSLASILGILGTCRYEMAMMLPENDEDGINIFAGGFLIACLWSLLLGGCVLWGGTNFLSATKYGVITPVIWMLPFVVLLTNLSTLINYWFNRNKFFGVNATLRLTNSILMRIGNLGGGFLGFRTGTYLIIVNFVVLLSTNVCKFMIFCKTSLGLLKCISYKKILTNLVRYKKFPLVDIWGAFLNMFSIQLAPLMIAYYFTPTDVGYYSQGLRLIQMPMVLVGSAVSQVYYQRASEAFHQGELPSVLSNVFSTLFAIGGFPFLVVGIYGRDIFGLLLGFQWQEAGFYAQIMAPWCWLVFCGSPISTTVTVMEYLGSYLVFNIITVSVRFISLLIGAYFGSCEFALILYSASGVFLWFCFLSFIFKKCGLPVFRVWLSNIKNNVFLLFFLIPLLMNKIFVSDLIERMIVLLCICIIFALYFIRYNQSGKKIAKGLGILKC
jgi:O-antigen/teichoic acid export membrane protein